MSALTIFLSAATVDLEEWRTILHDAFHRAGFNVRSQGKNLDIPLGDVRRLLVEHIEESDCVIHLAGLAGC